ncbi:MAG: diaminopimelate decarboxylase [Hyphomicrobiaceae bacterium]|nr:diaminopimelate decarboxylase [Hyphomicrobiaceae bacterium]
MHHFTYMSGTLHAEGVSLATIAAEVGTPVYVYSSGTIDRHYRAFAEAFADVPTKIFYAMKANSNLAVVKVLGDLGAGADTVSEGEIRKALAAGIPASRIVFSGVGKSEAELAFAVARGIYQVNIETESELHLLSRVAARQGRRQSAVFRINPDVGAGGHAKITTGSSENKFGVSLDESERLYAVAANLPGVAMKGLAVHIGSQIRVLGDLTAAFGRMRALTLKLRAQGHVVQRLDLGGGLGIPYEMAEAVVHGSDLIDSYAAMVKRIFAGLDVELGFEPGRIIVGNAGILLTRVLHHNARPTKIFLVVDAAMNDLVRPAMYDAFHDILPVVEPAKDAERQVYDVVGPICETSDTFAERRNLPAVGTGDLLAIMTAGAYGSAMASTYNSRLLVPEVLVRGNEFAVVRPRQTYEELIGLDRLATWHST